jgi:hypothetical protein
VDVSNAIIREYFRRLHNLPCGMQVGYHIVWWDEPLLTYNARDRIYCSRVLDAFGVALTADMFRYQIQAHLLHFPCEQHV